MLETRLVEQHGGGYDDGPSAEKKKLRISLQSTAEYDDEGQAQDGSSFRLEEVQGSDHRLLFQLLLLPLLHHGEAI